MGWTVQSQAARGGSGARAPAVLGLAFRVSRRLLASSCLRARTLSLWCRWSDLFFLGAGGHREDFFWAVDVIEGLLAKSTNFENYVLFGVLSSRSQP